MNDDRVGWMRCHKRRETEKGLELKDRRAELYPPVREGLYKGKGIRAVKKGFRDTHLFSCLYTMAFSSFLCFWTKSKAESHLSQASNQEYLFFVRSLVGWLIRYMVCSMVFASLVSDIDTYLHIHRERVRGKRGSWQLMNFDTRLTSRLTETNSSYLVLVVHIRGSYVTSVCGIVVSMIHAFVSE